MARAPRPPRCENSTGHSFTDWYSAEEAHATTPIAACVYCGASIPLDPLRYAREIAQGGTPT